MGRPLDSLCGSVQFERCRRLYWMPGLFLLEWKAKPVGMIIKGAKRFGAGVLAIVLLVTALVIVLGAMGTLLRMRSTPPHQLVEVEPGRHLHTVCEGPEGAPFVLYDAGAFGIYADGWWVMEALKADHRVCLYDRAGMGWSDPVPADVSPTPDWHVEDMRRLKAKLGVDQPAVLVGHSMAGIRLHAYANAYPKELRGLVFVDAARPQTLGQERVSAFVPWLRRAMTVSGALARVGIAGGVSYMLPDELALDGAQKQDKRRSVSAVSHHKATKAEMIAAFEAWPDASWSTETRAEQIPVFVFSNSESGGANAPVAEAALANTGLGGVTPLPDASHVSLLNRENAALIAADVRKITQGGKDGG